MRRAICLLATVALAVALLSLPAHADEPPEEFGTDWDDPRTAVKPIDKPGSESCEVKLVDHEFADFEAVKGKYKPPADCGDQWSKVVLRMEGSVSGRQYDRMGQLSIGDVPVFKTSTPQPSREGVEWRQEKDLTGYASLLESEQDTSMTLGNHVDETHTGAFDVRIYLTFYAVDGRHPAADSADEVLGLRDKQTKGRDLTGELRTPRNTEKLLADVYATGSGGGCEESWYLAAPAETGYSCRGDSGPYREVQVLIDGELAGMAAPYPNVYTGGWSNPFLWHTLPAPRAFDIRPITYDLTPYLGMLNDGKSHEVTVHVAGLEPAAEGWSTPTAFRAWRDAGSRVVNGGLVDAKTTAPAIDLTHSGDADGGEVRVEAEHSHTATGWLSTSHGEIVTSVERTVGNRSTHRWGEKEKSDSLEATWTDDQTRTVLGADGEVTRHTVERDYGVEGSMDIDDDERLTTQIKLSDAKRVADADSSGDQTEYSVSDSYKGHASFQRGVPREERHAVGDSKHRYRVSGDLPCYDYAISTQNGYVTREVDRCGKAVR
ncbi:MAG: peptide-N4-asparagine amidase [Stackebrandtia sp.]